MAPLWRAAGYLAYDECHFGHTIASLRYRDEDGQFRFHDLDPQRRYIHWDSRHNRIGTWSMPLMRGLVHRHLVAPQRVHTLRTSLRIGETVEHSGTAKALSSPGAGRPRRSFKGDQARRTSASGRDGGTASTRLPARKAKRSTSIRLRSISRRRSSRARPTSPARAQPDGPSFIPGWKA